MPSHETTLPHADPALAAGPRRSRFLSRSATLLLSLPLAMGTAGFGTVDTPPPAAAEPSYDGAGPARAAERLNRAPVAVDTEDGVFLSWRLLGDESMDAQFHVFRDGQQITTEPVTDSTNYLDPEGTVDSTYRVAVVKDGQLVWAGEEFSPWEDQRMDVPLGRPEGSTTPGGVEDVDSGNGVKG